MTHAEKLQRALAWLGTRWCLHPQSTYKAKWRGWR